jgi:hypothetical protein
MDRTTHRGSPRGRLAEGLMSGRAQGSAMPEHPSPTLRGGGSFPARADSTSGMCNWPSIPPPQCRPLARRDSDDDAKSRNVRSTRSLLLQPETWQEIGYGSTAAWLHRHPYIGASQTGVSIERQFSRIFPAHPRSLARCLSRAPSPQGTKTVRRGPRFCGTARLCFGFTALRVSAFRKSLCNERKRFSEPSEKAPLGLGSGAHSRRCAQECPEGNPGKYNQGEKQWHSMKTRSL